MKSARSAKASPGSSASKKCRMGCRCVIGRRRTGFSGLAFSAARQKLPGFWAFPGSPMCWAARKLMPRDNYLTVLWLFGRLVLLIEAKGVLDVGGHLRT